MQYVHCSRTTELLSISYCFIYFFNCTVSAVYNPLSCSYHFHLLINFYLLLAFISLSIVINNEIFTMLSFSLTSRHTSFLQHSYLPFIVNFHLLIFNFFVFI